MKSPSKRKPMVTLNMLTDQLTVLGRTNRKLRWDVEVVARKGNVENTLSFKPQFPTKASDLAPLVNKALAEDEDFKGADSVMMYVYLPKK